MRATSSSVKEMLKKGTSEAYEKGIFGAPTFVSNNKVFWGQDRIEFALNLSISFDLMVVYHNLQFTIY